MKSDIERLIEEYRSQKDSKGKAREAAKVESGKDGQRVKLLKQNEVFLTEFNTIKARLGQKFFSLLETPAPDAAAHREAVLNSDFAEPRFVIERYVLAKEDLEFEYYYASLGGIPYDEGKAFSDLDYDQVFNGPAPELIVIPEHQLDEIDIWTKEHKDWSKIEVYNRFYKAWQSFLEKWHIAISWKGDLGSLHLHSVPSVIVELDAKNHNLPVVIRVGAWATRDDVGDAWPAVRKKMKEAHVYMARKNDNARRDEIWHKQNRRLEMSPLQIAREWAKRFPKEIDLEVIKKLTMKEETFMGVAPEEVLEEVLSGDPSMAELKGRFIEARKAYISSGLRDRIKKSIQATERKIKRLGSEDWDRNRERLPKLVPIKREK
jgi:hypothetical protein